MLAVAKPDRARRAIHHDDGVVGARTEQIDGLAPRGKALALVDLEPKASHEDRGVGGAEHLIGSAVAPAQHFVSNRLGLGGGGRVRAHGDDAWRLVVGAVGEARPQPEARLGDCADDGGRDCPVVDGAQDRRGRFV